MPLPRARPLLTLPLLIGGGTLGYLYYSDTRAGAHRWLVQPLLLWSTQGDPEKAHRWAVKVLGSGWAPKDLEADLRKEGLEFELWGRRFSSPLGLAAGFDKHGEAIDGLYDLGFSYVEVGSVTPEPQPGNDTPRVFRLEDTQSLINRYGFNSYGHDSLIARLRERILSYVQSQKFTLPQSLFTHTDSPEEHALISHLPYYAVDPVSLLLASHPGSETTVTDTVNLPRSLREGRVLGINLGKNKWQYPSSIDDFVQDVRRLGPYADVLVINVSSPNTAGLRSLQRGDMLEDLLQGVIAERNKLSPVKTTDSKEWRPPIVLKISPDMNDTELEDVARAALECKVDGIIVGNTTIQRRSEWGDEITLKETGGLSGPPLKDLALHSLSTLYAYTSGTIPLVGCGGITSAADALDYARAGATFVQAYTAFGYNGVIWPGQIREGLAEELKKQGKSWLEVVGSQADPSKFGLRELTADEKHERWLNEVQDVKKDLSTVLEMLEKASAPANISESAELSQDVPDQSALPAAPVNAVPQNSSKTPLKEGQQQLRAVLPERDSQKKTLPPMPNYRMV
ncbi:hypothetical protein BT69DRAFT_1237772 [Atractiella rhizophila]|nr:hypothetical protein BT69DRAFT_1237772 [Atractiella rhizophila]